MAARPSRDASWPRCGARTPEGEKATVTPSFGTCTLTRCPLSTNSQMPVTRPARWKNGRYCFALRAAADEPQSGQSVGMSAENLYQALVLSVPVG